MGDKVTINPTGDPDGSSFTTSLNANLGVLADEFDKVVYRDGSQEMTGDLDMNSNRILNLPAPQNNSEPLRLADVEALSGDIIINDNSTTIVGDAGETTTFSNGPRIRATTYDQALTMASDFSMMEGNAEASGVTGGEGYDTYIINNESDDEGTIGSVRWAIAQSEAAGGGRCIVSPYGDYHVLLTETLYIPDNTTLDAPGRNLWLYTPGEFVALDCRQQNFVLRRFGLQRIGSQSTYTERDGISMLINTSVGDEVDRFWVSELTIRNMSDGAIDIAGSRVPTGQNRGTVDHIKFIDCAKTMFIGSTACTTTDVEIGNPPAWCDLALDEDPKILVTVHDCVYDHCAQRQPRVGTLAFVHSYNNVHTIVPKETDDGATASAMGAYVVLGGKLLSEYDYYRSAYGTGYIGIDVETTALTPAGGGSGAAYGLGAAQVNGSETEDGITLQTGQTDKIPPLLYSVSPVAIPSDLTEKADYVRSIEAGAGMEVDTAPQGQWVALDALGDFYPDGSNVYLRDGTYYARIDGTGLQVPTTLGASATAVALPRQGTVTLASNTITIGAEVNSVAVGPESGTTDDLETINGASRNGQLLLLRSNSGSNTITVKSTGNIRLDGNCAITDTLQILLQWDEGVSLWKEVARTRTPRLQSVSWAADTGTAKRTANATYSGTAEATYTQATIQALMNAVRDLSQTIKAMKDDLIA